MATDNAESQSFEKKSSPKRNCDTPSLGAPRLVRCCSLSSGGVENGLRSEAILASPHRIRRDQYTRSRARDSSLAAPPTECLCLRPRYACWSDVCLAWVHRQSSGRAFSPTIVPGVNLFLRADEQSTSRLNIVERLGGRVLIRLRRSPRESKIQSANPVSMSISTWTV